MVDQSCKEFKQIEVIQNQISDTLTAIDSIRNKYFNLTDAESLEGMERLIASYTDRLAGLITALKMQQALASEALCSEASELVKNFPNKLKSQGVRLVSVQTCRGESVEIAVRYYSRKKMFGKKTASSDRPGIYPGFTLLGIFDHCTPLLISEVAMFAAMLSSFEETSNVFQDKGLNLHVNTIRRIVERFAKRAVIARQIDGLPGTETLKGGTVVVSTDGGRIRIRKDKRGPRTKKGRRRYSTCWREPKLLIIYTVDENGKMDRSFAPFIEGTLKGPDAVFGLIRYHLSRLSVHLAEKILFIADGARWIWNRTAELIRSLGIAPDKVYELIDFYHAVEHLTKFAELKKGWSSSKKRSWVKKHRRLLFNGRANQVINAIDELCRGRHSKKIATERDYFVRNRHRMCYQILKEQNLPIGSGAIESAVRRVINLRLKGASIYWLEANAEAMLLLRSYYKAGRWNILKVHAFSSKSVNAN